MGAASAANEHHELQNKNGTRNGPVFFCVDIKGALFLIQRIDAANAPWPQARLPPHPSPARVHHPPLEPLIAMHPANARQQVIHLRKGQGRVYALGAMSSVFKADCAETILSLVDVETVFVTVAVLAPIGKD